MINRVYRLKSTEYIEQDFETVDLTDQTVVVRPRYLAICAADQRYYMGKRSPEVMAKKLPMALIHEGIGVVVMDPTNTFRAGDHVVMLPNMAAEDQLFIKENYRSKSKFLSSGYDGFMRDYVTVPPRQLVKLPDEECMHYVLCELISVACNAITTCKGMIPGEKYRIGVWGTGSVGYVTALALRALYPDSHITVIGRNRDKLSLFSFADRRLKNTEADFGEPFDFCFECVGGTGSYSAIDQMIAKIRPQGTIVLMGVSEEPAPIDTRMVLEKGLTLLGASRSGREDFEMAVSIIRDNPSMVNYLSAIVSKVVPIKRAEDINTAFRTDSTVPYKTVMEWRI